MKISKWAKRAALTVLMATAACLAVGCGGSTEGAPQEDEFTGFLKGYLQNVEIGSEFRLNEYVDMVGDSDYTIVVAKKDGSFSEDMTRTYAWDTRVATPGAYTITYTIASGENKGTYVCDFNIVVPKLKVSYKLQAEHMEAQLGSTITFAEYFQTVEWNIQSYYDYTIRPELVWIGEEGEASLAGQTSFTFTQDEQHAFHFTVVTEDEQSYPIVIPIDVVKSSQNAQAFMQDNNAVFYKYNEIDDNVGVDFKAGFSRGGSNNRQDVGYVAFKGNYGAGNYVKVDFTGNNLPKVAFFTNKIIGKLNDGSKGVYVGNGHWHDWKKWQYDQNAYTVYGPNKVVGGVFSTNSQDTLWTDTTAAIAGAKLEKEPERKYTYYVGVREAKDASQVAEGEKPYMVLECLLIDRDTQEVVYHCDQKIESEHFKAGYFTGNIVLYANFGYETKFDKVYPLQQADTVMDFDKSLPLFKTSAPTSVAADQAVTPSDFAAITAGTLLGYIKSSANIDGLFITNTQNGKKTINVEWDGFVNVTNEETFTFGQVGEYTVYYQVAGKYAPASMTITVTMPEAPYFTENAPTSVGFDEKFTPTDFADMAMGSVLGYIATEKITDALFVTTTDGRTTLNTAHDGFVNVTNQTQFSFETIGEYTVYYQVADRLRPASMQVSVYNPFFIDFENGVNDIIKTNGNDTCTLVGPQGTTATVPIATTSNALKYDPNDWDFDIGFDLAWLQRLFSATEATGVQFKVYTDKQWANIKADGKHLTAFQLYSPNGGCQVWSGYTWEDKGDYLLVTLTRTAIESYIALNAAAANPATTMILSMRLGVLDTNESSATYNKIVWGPCDFVYLDDFEAAYPANA